MMRKLLSALLLALLVLPAMAQENLSYGMTVSGEITNAMPEVRYTFEGMAGDVVSIRMAAIQQGLDSYLQLLDADGNLLQFDDDSAGNLNSLLGPYTLPQDATYTIVATRCCPGGGGSTGAFELTLERMELTVLALNETYTLQMTDDNLITYFAYDATAGDILNVQAQVIAGVGGVNLEIRDPQGNYISGGYAPVGSPGGIDLAYLNEAGRYLLVLRSDSFYVPADQRPPTDLTLELTVTQVQTMSITVGETVTGELNDANPADYYAFEANAGSLLRMVGEETGSGPFEVQIYSPAGFSFNGGVTAYGIMPGSLTIDPLQIDTTGRYVVLVRRLSMEGPLDGTSRGYRITLGMTDAPQLEDGVEVTGVINAEIFEQVYIYQGIGGQTVRVSLRSLSDSYGPGLNVQGPPVPSDDAVNDGVMGGGGGGSMPPNFIMSVNGGLPAAVTYEVTLPADGVYLFRVNNSAYSYDGPQSGEFSLMVEVIN